MTTWYSVATPDQASRLVAAWSDAPVENEELCGFLLDVARMQVEEFAPDRPTPGIQPVTIPLAGDGSSGSLTLTREGDVVRGVATVTVEVGGWDPEVPQASIPAGFLWHENAYLDVPQSFNVYGTAPNQKLLVYGVEGETVTRSMLWVTADPLPDLEPTGTPADVFMGTLYGTDPGIPYNLVYAQLMQAQNLWNAGRGNSNGDVGTEGYSYTPRPLDKTVRSIIRPTSGVPDVF